MKKIIFAINFTLFVISGGHSLYAEVVYDAHVHAELISELKAIQPGVLFWLALKMEMDDSWHTYWKNPGDSGLSTHIQWDLPTGFRVSEIYWPYPQRIEQPPLTSFGYTSEILLLAKVTPPQDLTEGNPIRIQSHANWLACQISCIPGKGDFAIDLPVSRPQDQTQINPAWIEQFAQARLRVPSEVVPWALQASAEGNKVVLSILSGQGDLGVFSEVYFFPEQGDLLNHSSKQVWEQFNNGQRLTLTRSVISSPNIQSLKGILFLGDGEENKTSKSYQINIPLHPGFKEEQTKPLTLPSYPEKIHLLVILLFAFIGGLILNLMPCVFPILALKALHLLEMSQKDRRKVARHGILFTLGIVFSFCVLAGILILLRTIGQQVGWGFQLQSKAFVIFLIFLFFVLSLNLMGLFEIGVLLSFSLPRKTQDNHWIPPFLSGVLTTLVATPCTAPFMGTALGVALTQPLAIAFLIFILLGLGMAFPYLLLSFFPQWIVFVPKPGLWMVHLKKFFGLMLMGVVVWLLWILARQSSPNTVCFLLVVLLFWAFGLWISEMNRRSTTFKGRKSNDDKIIILFILIGSFITLFCIMRQNFQPVFLQLSSISNQQSIHWEPYSEDLMKTMCAQNKIIFLNFTADWCLTCQMNEEVVFQNKEVIKKFKELSVVAIKADWTTRDAQITKALADFGRNSIPLYVVWGKDPGEAPVLLSEIITPGIVVKALDKIQ